MFGTKKKILELTQEQCGVLLHSLKDKRNQMLKDDIATDEIDDVLLKVIAVIEEPVRKAGRYHEAR